MRKLVTFRNILDLHMKLNNNIKNSIPLQIPFKNSKVIKKYKQQADVSEIPTYHQIIERTHDILTAVDFMIVINKMQQTIYESVETKTLKHITRNIPDSKHYLIFQKKNARDLQVVDIVIIVLQKIVVDVRIV